MARAYSHQGHGPRADQTGRIDISDFRYPAHFLLRTAAGQYIGSIFTVYAMILERLLYDPKPVYRTANPIGCFWPKAAVALKPSRMSAMGQKRTSRPIAIYVRYWGLSGHSRHSRLHHRSARYG